MVLVSGQLCDPNDVYKIVNAALLTSINAKKEILDSSHTTSTWDYHFAETFNTNTGDSTTVATATTNAYYVGTTESFFTPKSYLNTTKYDDFGDASVATASWATGAAACFGIRETGGYIEIYQGNSSGGVATVASNALPATASLQHVRAWITCTIADRTDDVLKASLLFGGGTIKSVNTLSGPLIFEGTYDVIKSGANYIGYENGTAIATVAPSSNQLVLKTESGGTTDPGPPSVNLQMLYVNYNNSNYTVTTNTVLNAPSNIKGVYVAANTVKTANAGLTYDVSLNGGSTWSFTGKNANTYVDTSTTTGTALALRFSLTGSATAYPVDQMELRNYGVMVFT